MLTLLVNLAIMTVAYYAVLGAVAWVDGAWFRPHWEAPALDPALLKAIAMIFLQLAIVTAVALLLLDLLEPDAVGRADLRSVRRRATSTPTSETSRRSSIRSRSAYVARALYYLLPNLAPFDIKNEVVHAVPVPAAYLLLNTAYALVYIAILLSSPRRSSSARRDFK